MVELLYAEAAAGANSESAKYSELYKKIIEVANNAKGIAALADEYKSQESWQYRSFLQSVTINSKTPFELSRNLLDNQHICPNITYENKEHSFYSLIKEILAPETNTRKGFELEILSHLHRGPQWFESKNYNFGINKRAA